MTYADIVNNIEIKHPISCIYNDSMLQSNLLK
jgi:hypothetical protein